MAIPLYLAMTAAEFRQTSTPPAHCAWMACHFSPYGTGLTNIPQTLPEGALLILNDRTPVHGHDPQRIFQALRQTVEKLKCGGLLLDLQRPGSAEAAAIAAELVQLPCPVAVSDLYARDLDCPVFLPPVPLRMTPAEYLAPWAGREIWLDAAPEGEVITVTGSGSRSAPLPPGEEPECPHDDVQLFCHYGIKIAPNEAVFTLKRTKNDLKNLLESVESSQLTTAVALWQEWEGKL